MRVLNVGSCGSLMYIINYTGWTTVSWCVHGIHGSVTDIPGTFAMFIVELTQVINHFFQPIQSSHRSQ